MTPSERMIMLDRAIEGDWEARAAIYHMLRECSDDLLNDDAFFQALSEYVVHCSGLRKPS